MRACDKGAQTQALAMGEETGKEEGGSDRNITHSFFPRLGESKISLFRAVNLILPPVWSGGKSFLLFFLFFFFGQKVPLIQRLNNDKLCRRNSHGGVW